MSNSKGFILDAEKQIYMQWEKESLLGVFQ